MYIGLHNEFQISIFISFMFIRGPVLKGSNLQYIDNTG